MRSRHEAAVPEQSSAFAVLLAEIRERLRQMGAASLIREDEIAAELFGDLARAEGMEAFSATLTRLGDRIDEIIIARTGAAPGAASRLNRLPAQHAAARDETPSPRARTFLKL